MPDGTGIDQALEKFPERSFDVGIAEQHCVTFAAGMSTEGLKPVCAIYSTSLQRAFDQIAHDVCLQNLDVKFCMDRAGIVGGDGLTHHGLLDIAYLRGVPNMIAMAPKDEGEMRDMLYTMLQHEGPAAMRYPRGNGVGADIRRAPRLLEVDRKSTRLNSSHANISYAVFCLNTKQTTTPRHAINPLINTIHRLQTQLTPTRDADRFATGTYPARARPL